MRGRCRISSGMEGLTQIDTDDTDLRTSNGKCEMRGFLRCAVRDETASCFGRNDDSLVLI
jgi:hypothetical protein